MKKLTNTDNRCGHFDLSGLNLTDKTCKINIWETEAIHTTPGEFGRANEFLYTFHDASYDLEVDTFQAILTAILNDLVTQGVLPTGGTWSVA